jgi:hypothetical protein
VCQNLPVVSVYGIIQVTGKWEVNECRWYQISGTIRIEGEGVEWERGRGGTCVCLRRQHGEREGINW